MSRTSIARREDALQGDDEIQGEIWLYIGVWLNTARVHDGRWIERGQVAGLGVVKLEVGGRQNISCGIGLIGSGQRALRDVVMSRQFLNDERMILLAAFFSDGKPLALVNRDAAAKVRKREIGLSVAAIGRAEDGE